MLRPLLHPRGRSAFGGTLGGTLARAARVAGGMPTRGTLACGVALALATGSARPEPAGAQEGPLVLAASSLTDALRTAAEEWQRAGGAPVRLSFAATSRLAPQALRGGGDAFVSADRRWIDWLESRGAIAPGSAVHLASNTLVVVVPREASLGGAPPAISSPGDLGGSRVRRLVLAGESVPAGRYARAALEEAGVWDTVRERVVRGESARSVLEWVARGEADAGVVYATDARVEPRVRVAFPLDEGSGAGSGADIGYWGAVLTDARRAHDARAFLDFLAEGAGREILAAAGFGPPEEAARTGPKAEAEPTLPDPVSAVLLSLGVALLATVAAAPPAILLGWLLARRRFRGKTLVSGLVLAPLVLPPVVTGFLLLSLLGRSSLVGGWLAALGMPVPFTFLGAAVAAFVVGLPLFVVVARGAFEAVDPRLEEVSWTLGRPRRETFRRITLPLAIPGIAAGAVLAFARALGEFGATVVLAGNVEGETRTIALAVYTLLESPGGGRMAWGLVGASLLLSLAALAAYEALSRRQRRLREEHRGR